MMHKQRQRSRVPVRITWRARLHHPLRSVVEWVRSWSLNRRRFEQQDRGEWAGEIPRAFTARVCSRTTMCSMRLLAAVRGVHSHLGGHFDVVRARGQRL